VAISDASPDQQITIIMIIIIMMIIVIMVIIMNNCTNIIYNIFPLVFVQSILPDFGAFQSQGLKKIQG